MLLTHAHMMFFDCWVTSQMWSWQFRRMRLSGHKHEWGIQTHGGCQVINMNEVSLNLLYHTYVHVIHMNDSCLTSHVSHMRHEWDMSWVWMRYVTRYVKWLTRCVTWLNFDPWGCQVINMKVQPIADRVAQHLEIISKTFPTNQNSAHGSYD